jgi:RNA polymerase primary sigma factor
MIIQELPIPILSLQRVEFNKIYKDPYVDVLINKIDNVITIFNDRLVWKLVREHIGSSEELDAFQDGNEGLLIALYKFDITRGNKFSTYASNWIRQRIVRGREEQTTTIRVPTYARSKIRAYGRRRLALRKELGREPSQEEVFELGYNGVSESYKETIKSALRAFSTTSLDIELDSDDNNLRTLKSYIHSEKLNLKKIVDKNDDKNTVKLMLETLTAKEERILALRFGLNGYEPHTLEDVGKKFGVTRERIRQIENVALRKITRIPGIEKYRL